MPVWASWNLPRCFAFAPVNEPFSWPNKIDSTRLSGIAPQLTVTKGCPARCDAPWIARAITSLPTPLSPVIRIGILAFAPRSPIATTERIEGAFPIRSSNCNAPSTVFFSRLTSTANVLISSALRRDTIIRSGLAGLTIKSRAPLCIALTTVSIEPLPVSTMTGRVGRDFCSSASVSIPSRPGMIRSSNIRSILPLSAPVAILSAASPSSACKVENPCFSTTARKSRRCVGSSSTIRTVLAIFHLLSSSRDISESAKSPSFAPI